MKQQTLTKEQHAALSAFAKRTGRTWKAQLAIAWANGNYGRPHKDDEVPNYATHLQQVRNAFGPDWLKTFKLEEWKEPRPKQNRIWIELDKPIDKAHAEEQCRLANLVLAKLQQPGNEDPSKFFVSHHEDYPRYCYGNNWGFRELSDNGEWLNLDYIALPTPKT